VQGRDRLPECRPDRVGAGADLRVHRGIDLDQARRLIEESRNDRFHALYVLTLYLGMRRAELPGLRWVDVDFARGTLEIVQTLQRVDGQLRFVLDERLR
jgi:integrase